MVIGNSSPVFPPECSISFGPLAAVRFLLFFFLKCTTPGDAKGYQFKSSKPAMHFTRITNYAVRLSVTQVGSVTGAQAGDKIVLPSALLLALFGLGLSTFSVKQLLSSPKSSRF